MKPFTKILIAEHDPVDLDLVNYELENSGIHFISQVVQNEKDYVLAITNFKPDLILSDFTFPSFDGPTAFAIRQLLAPETPFIFVSGTIGEERSIELIKTGVTDYCLKDHLVTLNHKISRAIAQSAALLQKEKIQHDLLKSEKRLSRAQQLAHIGNWDLDFTQNMLNWSEETFRIYGMVPDNRRQSLDSVLYVVHPEDLDYVQKSIEKARSCVDNFFITYRIILKDGSVRYVSLDGEPEINNKGQVTGIFAITQDITEVFLLEKKLVQERKNKQKEITDAVLTAQENERAEIGKELHDNLNQILGATKLYIELAKTDPELRDMCLKKSSEYLVNVIEEIRRISKIMIIPGLNALGLFDCIKILANDLSFVHPIKIRFKVIGVDEKDLKDNLQLTIYRIVQEQLTNILKHAQASNASIMITRKGDEVILLIADNGKGFDISEMRRGVGIRNIMSRAESFHGRMEIKTQLGRGYKLRVGLPLQPTVSTSVPAGQNYITKDNE